MLNGTSRNIDKVESNVQQAQQQSADMSDHYSKTHLSIRQRCVAVIKARGGHTRYYFYYVIFHLKGMSSQWKFAECCYQILAWDVSQLQVETCIIYCE
jgi:hypothetical protein